MALTYRSKKGSALTIDELDSNFRHFTGSHSITGSLTITDSATITGSLSISGNGTFTDTVSASGFIHPIATAASQDLATNANYSVNGSKVEVRAITAAQIDDGDFATFKLLNTSIATNSIVLGSFTGEHSGSAPITGSILTATTIAASTASVFIHNETGANIGADTSFTASFVIF